MTFQREHENDATYVTYLIKGLPRKMVLLRETQSDCIIFTALKVGEDQEGITMETGQDATFCE
jgi:hypothetical protein